MAFTSKTTVFHLVLETSQLYSIPIKYSTDGELQEKFQLSLKSASGIRLPLTYIDPATGQSRKLTDIKQITEVPGNSVLFKCDPLQDSSDSGNSSLDEAPIVHRGHRCVDRERARSRSRGHSRGRSRGHSREKSRSHDYWAFETSRPNRGRRLGHSRTEANLGFTPDVAGGVNQRDRSCSRGHSRGRSRGHSRKRSRSRSRSASKTRDVISDLDYFGPGFRTPPFYQYRHLYKDLPTPPPHRPIQVPSGYFDRNEERRTTKKRH